MAPIVLVECQSVLFALLVKLAWMALTMLLLRTVIQGLIVLLERVPVCHVLLGPIVLQGHHFVDPVLWGTHVMIPARPHRLVLQDSIGIMVQR